MPRLYLAAAAHSRCSLTAEEPARPLAAAAQLLLQLTKRYEAAVRVCQYNSGPRGSRARNVGNILEKEKEIKQQLQQAGGEAALATA